MNLIQELNELKNIKSCANRKKKLRTITDNVEYGYKMTELELDALFDVIKKHTRPERGTWLRSDYKTAIFTKHRRFHVSSIELITNDETYVEISNGMIVGEKEATKNEQISKALRYSIYDQIINFRQSVPKTLCPITGDRLTNYNAEVDHIIPFCNLRDMFLSTLTSEPETILCRETNTWFLKDRDIDAKWKEFHQTHAKLRWISCDGNKIYLRQCVSDLII